MNTLKKIISLLLATVILYTFVPSSFAAEPRVIYVSLDGRDDAAGTIDAPLKTIEGAKQKILDLKNNVSEVVFRGGEYRIKDTVVFSAKDSGTQEKPIVYRAYEGEKVSFKRSIELDAKSAKPVTDKDVLNRLHKDAIGNLIQIDLKEYGLTKSDILNTESLNGNTDFSLVPGTETGQDYNTLYIDDKEIDIAQWPNGANNFVSWKYSTGHSSFCYVEQNPARWVNAPKGWWIGAFPNYDYKYNANTVTNIDVKKKEITVKNGTYGYTNPWSKRWKAFNLLEELDIPGEFHIDRESMTLYLYPPYSLADAKMELSIGTTDMFKGEAVSHITFKDIEFSQAAGRVFNLRNNIYNFDFIDCVFRNIGNCAVEYYGNVSVKSENYGGKKNCSYDCDIRGCIFENTGASAIFMNGGDIDTLTPANNVIENNYFYRNQTRFFMLGAVIKVQGCGITVRQNTISHCRQQGIWFDTNDSLIEKNEVYDMIREVGDAGAIYCGNTQILRNNTVRHNYVHDIQPGDKRLVSGTVSIYMDDQVQGNFVYQNIIKNSKTGYNANGAGNIKVLNNTIIDTLYHLSLFAAPMGDEPISDRARGNKTIAETVAKLPNIEIFFNAYPDFKDWVINKTNAKLLNVYDGNFISGDSQLRSNAQDDKFAQWGKNIQVDSKDMFVDPDNQDYRLKSDSPYAKELPDVLNEDNFDINVIGVQNEFVFNEETSPFRLIYPQNGMLVSASEDIMLKWEEPIGANSYRVTVAKDADFNNIVYDEKVRFCNTTLKVDKNERYYWKVTAINESRAHAGEWAHDGAVYTFTTKAYDELDTFNYENTLSLVKEDIESSIEGSTPGVYKEGTSSFIKNYINITNVLLNLRLGLYSQKSLDARTQYISDYYGSHAERNPGFVDLLQYNGIKGAWSNMAVDAESITNNTGSLSQKTAGSALLAPMSGSVIYCFDIVAQNSDGSFMVPFGLNKLPEQQWNAANNGYTVVSKIDCLELQKQDGTTNALLEVYNGKTVADGKRHSVMFGYLNTAAGCNILLVVDDEVIFNYPDATLTSHKGEALQFASTVRPTGAEVKYLRSSKIPTAEDFARLQLFSETNVAMASVNAFPGIKNGVFFKDGKNSVVTGDAIYDVSYATPDLLGEELMVPVSVLAKIFKGTENSNGNRAVLNLRGNEFVFNNGTARFTLNGSAKTATNAAYVKNGHLMVSLRSVAESIGSTAIYDYLNGTTVVVDEGLPHVINDSRYYEVVSISIDAVSKLDLKKDVFAVKKN